MVPVVESLEAGRIQIRKKCVQESDVQAIAKPISGTGDRPSQKVNTDIRRATGKTSDRVQASESESMRQ